MYFFLTCFFIFTFYMTGGASTSMLDRIFVDYFGTPTALNQVARVSTSGAQQLVIEPFDKSVCKEIEKAISNSDLNLTANNDGTGIIRINVSKSALLFLLLSEDSGMFHIGGT